MSGGGGVLVRTMDGLETVEKLMSIEEAFGAEIP
jgi:acyl carrier protein